MKTATAMFSAAALAGALCALPAASGAAAGDVAAITALEARFAAAFNAGNVDAIMKVYAPGQGLVVFDVVPPRQYVGAAAYRKDWQNFFATLKGPPKFTISDLYVAADRNLAYSHSIQRVSGTGTDGKPVDLTVRVTDVYRKIGGRWLIVHEHVSVPVDLATDKPDLASTP
jgi:ketosteroid isomerase-like protein